MKYLLLAATLLMPVVSNTMTADESLDTFHGVPTSQDGSENASNDNSSSVFEEVATGVNRLGGWMSKLFHDVTNASITPPTPTPNDNSGSIESKETTTAQTIKRNAEGQVTNASSSTSTTSINKEHSSNDTLPTQSEVESSSKKTNNTVSNFNFNNFDAGTTGVVLGSAAVGAFTFHKMSDYIIKKYKITPGSTLYKTLKVISPVTGAVVIGLIGHTIYKNVQ